MGSPRSLRARVGKSLFIHRLSIICALLHASGGEPSVSSATVYNLQGTDVANLIYCGQEKKANVSAIERRTSGWPCLAI